VAIAVLVVGCGGGGDGNSTDSGQTDPRALPLPPGPSREFVIPGGDNTIQYFGREGSETEREEASTVVESWDRARAARKWEVDCRYLSRPYTDIIVTDAEGVSNGKATTCVQALAFFGSVASGGSDATTTGPIDSLRLTRGTGYAQYHGRNGIDWIVPLKKEDGEWKVEVTAPVDRRK